MTETDMNRTEGMHNHERDITTGSARIPPLNDDLFARELDYQASMSIAEGLQRLGFLTDREVREAKVLLLAKHRPLIGELVAEAG